MAGNFTWSPWHARPRPRGAAGSAEDGAAEPGEPSPELRPWRIRDRCLRIASYYRVMHLHEQAADRRRRAETRTRFQKWAATVVRQRRAAVAAEHAEEAAGAKRARRGGLPSGATRMAARPAGFYDGTRRYAARAPDEVRKARLLAGRRRVNVTAAAEVGPVLHAVLAGIAQSCVAERRGEG